jgi:signal peptidase I
LTTYDSPAQIKRGDIVEYKSTNGLVKKSTASSRLVHRIVALPGERIVIKEGVVTVYNQQHPEGFNPDTIYLKQPVTTVGNVDVTLSAKQYFVLGDNRPDALDSRATGPISYADIIAKAGN